jgi:cytoskeletal protein RodZ
MDCEDVKQLFSGFLDSRLTLFQSALLIEHCDACSECRSELIRLQKLQQPPTNDFRRLVVRLHALRAPLGGAGLLLAGFFAFYLFERAPAEAPAVKPAPASESNVQSRPAAKSLEHGSDPAAASLETTPPTKTREKSSPPSPKKLKPNVAAPRNSYAAARPENRGNRPALAETQKATSDTDAAESSDVSESSSTAQDEEAAPDEKSADAGELRFYSEIPPYFFLYKPSMKPL